MNRSIVDVENAILNILENTSSIVRFIESLTLNKSIEVINHNNKDFKKELYREVVAFKNNNIGTLEKLIVFYDLNKSLRVEIEKELQKN